MQRLDTVLKSKNVAGVEIILNGSSMSIHCALLKKEKGKVQLISGTKVEGVANLKQLVPLDAPVILSISGKGIIHKKVSVSEKDTDKTALQKVFPNASENEFYVQRTGISKDEIFISVVRKDTADTLLKELSATGLNIIGCSLGPFSINTILPLMNGHSLQYDLKFCGQKLSITGNRINILELMDTNGAGEKIKVGDDEIAGAQLVSFASGLQYFIGDQQNSTIPFVKDAAKEYRQKRIFKTAGISVIALFFTLLLINFFLFTHFNESYADLNQKVQMNTALLSGVEKLKAEITSKEKFMEQTGLLEASRTSFYADQVAMDLPVAIQLKQLNIYPLVKKNIADASEMAFTPRTVLISGTSDKSTDLNEWIKILKQKEWVKNVSVMNYTQDNSKKAGDFSIEVMIK